MEPVATPRGEARVQVDTHLGPGAERTLADDVLDGLTKPFKEIPPKHFYDERGSRLFEQIVDLPEYYPPRAERAILESTAAAIVAQTRAVELVELGSGTPDKARVLLDAMEAAGGLRRYVPLDVSEAVIRASATDLVAEYPTLKVHGVIGDFERHLDRVPPAVGPRLLAFLGGTIGNFPPGSRRRFLRDVARLLGPEDHLLLGTDLVKDPRILEAAYNDAAGVTAEFNRNVLHVINRELDADFVPERFEHVAFFDRRRQWVEMRLRSTEDQIVNIRAVDLGLAFARNEELRTEISAKFTRERVERDLAAAGLALVGWHTDPAELFALSLARPD
jgi:L-histidine N-alpha-methyltransferase